MLKYTGIIQNHNTTIYSHIDTKLSLSQESLYGTRVLKYIVLLQCNPEWKWLFGRPSKDTL